MTSRLPRRAATITALGFALACGSHLQARVTRIDVEKVDPAPVVAGAQAYEIVTGRFYGEVDPGDPRNAIITDLEFAPRNERGYVEYSATFAIARPANARDASGMLLYDVPNRGNGRVAADPSGHVRVISGWQGDLPEDIGLQTARVPIARNRDGRPLTGPVLARIIDMPAGTKSLPIVGSIGRPTAMPEPLTLNPGNARLYVQSRPGGALRALSARDWVFADCSQSRFPGKADPGKLCVRNGFDSRLVYTLAYTAKDPKVMGLGFAATRDLISFLRHARADDMGNPNPAGSIRWAVASGISQSGNYLKSFVNLGFNADEAGRMVFDGINPNIAARQVPLNLRFSVPGGAARPYEPGSEGVLWWSPYTDNDRGRGTSSLLDRCTISKTCPKIVETFGSAEFWGLRMSPGLVGTRADIDIPLPDNVRRYYFPGVTHGGSLTGGFPVKGDPVPSGCLLPGNPNPMIPELRVAQRKLVEWVRNGTEPPASSYPTLAARDLVPPNSTDLGWPHLAGWPTPDGKINPMPNYDFGTTVIYNDVSGVLNRLPPRIGREIPQLVPRLDADGNEVSGIRSVNLAVPLGTYLGWNVQASGFSRGEGCGFAGGFIPFARTKAERHAANDPRLSLEERYGNHEGFIAQVKKAVAQHQATGWLTAQDGARIIEQAASSDVLLPPSSITYTH